MSQLLIVYASTSGHTEYVCTHIGQELAKKKRSVEVILQRAEQTTEADILKADYVIFASSTWNTGGIEGQLNPHMFTLVHKYLAGTDLEQKPVAIIGCGDDRYRYTCAAADKLLEFVEEHNGLPWVEELRIINEPYGQEAFFIKWAKQCAASLPKL